MSLPHKNHGVLRVRGSRGGARGEPRNYRLPNVSEGKWIKTHLINKSA